MTAIRVCRAVLALTAAACFGYGVWRLLRVGLPNLWAAVQWLIGGVVVNDGLIAPAVVLGGVLLVRVLPRWAQAPTIVGGVILGSVTLVAVPELGRFGAHADNPTLLDRPYGAGWLAFAAVVVLSSLGWALVQRRQARPDPGEANT